MKKTYETNYSEVSEEIERLESTRWGRVRLSLIMHLPGPILDAWDWLEEMLRSRACAISDCDIPHEPYSRYCAQHQRRPDTQLLSRLKKQRADPET